MNIRPLILWRPAAWVVLTASALAWDAGPLCAQRASTESAIPVWQSVPATEEAPPRTGSVTRLSVGERIQLVRQAGLQVDGIEKELRLSARSPHAPNGWLKASDATGFWAMADGGFISLFGGSDPGSLTVTLKLGTAKQPVLVDFVLSAWPQPGNSRVTTNLHGSGIMEPRELQQGDHHVAAVIMPQQAGSYFLRLEMPVTEKGSVVVEAVEITILN